MITTMLIAGLGGFLGTVARYLMNRLTSWLWPSKYPWGTLLINLSGCFVIGLFFGLWGRHEIDLTLKALLITGFCGGYTTFSMYNHELFMMLCSRRWLMALLYVVPTVVGGLWMVYLGIRLIDPAGV